MAFCRRIVPPRSSEALGIAFFEKGRTGIAESVLTRAIEALAGADDEKIGLIYWLGRAHEAQGRAEEALRWYERALRLTLPSSTSVNAFSA